jgi:hypothetical protein
VASVYAYSETCEIRTPLGHAKSVPNWEVSSFQMVICTENSSLGPDEVSLFHRMSSFRRVAIHMFHCNMSSLHKHHYFVMFNHWLRQEGSVNF